MKIKTIILRLILGYKCTSGSYINYLKKMGVSIGDDVTIYRPFNTTIDVTSPHLLSIGSHVVITGPATILTHDYSWSVLKRKYGYIVGNTRKTQIGNNVFIGWGATILGGTYIGDNVIIGASSVVSGKIESDSVYAGNPARKIMTIEEFYDRRKKTQVKEASVFVNEYQKRFGHAPEQTLLDEYFFIFSNSSHNERYDAQLSLTGNFEESNVLYEGHIPFFENYECFLDYCRENQDN